MIATDIQKALREYVKPEKAGFLPYFFKTGVGQYGEGDKFLCVMVPDVRKVVKTFWQAADKTTIIHLLHSKWHEERLVALLILVEKFAHGDKKTQKAVFDLYLANTQFINNWDLVDLSCYKIVGRYLYEHPRERHVFDQLADSDLLWNRRIAVVSCEYFLQRGDPSVTFYIVRKLLPDSQDLIQKASGWMLREVGKRVDEGLLVDFIKQNYDEMSRTTLRYATERFSSDIRKDILRGNFNNLETK